MKIPGATAGDSAGDGRPIAGPLPMRVHPSACVFYLWVFTLLLCIFIYCIASYVRFYFLASGYSGPLDFPWRVGCYWGKRPNIQAMSECHRKPRTRVDHDDWEAYVSKVRSLIPTLRGGTNEVSLLRTYVLWLVVLSGEPFDSDITLTYPDLDFIREWGGKIIITGTGTDGDYGSDGDFYGSYGGSETTSNLWSYAMWFFAKI